jgi:hypothetical protein
MELMPFSIWLPIGDACRRLAREKNPVRRSPVAPERLHALPARVGHRRRQTTVRPDVEAGRLNDSTGLLSDVDRLPRSRRAGSIV